jgi:hypothetical protein
MTGIVTQRFGYVAGLLGVTGVGFLAVVLVLEFMPETNPALPAPLVSRAPIKSRSSRAELDFECAKAHRSANWRALGVRIKLDKGRHHLQLAARLALPSRIDPVDEFAQPALTQLREGAQEIEILPAQAQISSKLSQ